VVPGWSVLDLQSLERLGCETVTMPFVRSGHGGTVPANPADLYRELPKRPGAPVNVWLHQGDLLRAYYSDHVSTDDVALELPTGAGKTLVRALIAEWRRRAMNERVAYLCPTRQLARQVADRIQSYGIDPVTLVGPHTGWNAADRMRFESGSAIAVTTYSTVFNSNPRLDSAQALILDDAHAAESYVAGPWSLVIERDDAAYQDALAVLKLALDPLVVARLRADSPDQNFVTTVYLASLRGVHQQAQVLEAALRTAATTGGLSTSARYAFRTLEGHLGECLIFASYRALLIRPLISPTAFHPAFENPVQRVYMSASLGDGGELERSFGRTEVARVPVPEGWDKQGTGRRFFCFPESTSDLASATAQERNEFVASVIRGVGKGVVLAPDRRTLNDFVESSAPNGVQIFDADQIEDNLAVFANAGTGLLTLANRYDGIDLPDQSCRLVILTRLPAGGSLQERFLHESIGAIGVLQERIRARIAQGAGRATRNSSDFAVVLLLGHDFTSFCARADVRASMHPELQAEMSFGLDNSFTSSGGMRQNLQHFLNQDDEWTTVEGDLVAQRNSASRTPAPGSIELQQAVKYEVQAWRAIWQREFPRAIELSRKVVDALTGGGPLRPYQALWNYLGSSWAAIAASGSEDPEYWEMARRLHAAARGAARGTTWLSHLAAPADALPELRLEDVDALDASAADAIVESLGSLDRSSTFDSTVSAMRAALLTTDPVPYEEALVTLGRFAGASTVTGSGGATAAPDACWQFGEDLWVATDWFCKCHHDTANPGASSGLQCCRGTRLRHQAFKRCRARGPVCPRVAIYPLEDRSRR
jgi:DEAD/DEAH box helicase